MLKRILLLSILTIIIRAGSYVYYEHTCKCNTPSSNGQFCQSEYCFIQGKIEYIGPNATCFSSNSLVQTYNRRNNKIEELQITSLEVGDQVVIDYDKNDQPILEEVIGWAHKSDSEIAEFLHLNMQDGSYLDVSPDHVVYYQQFKDGYVATKLAKDLKVGDYLITKAALIPITYISTAYPQGFYTPITRSGNLLVNGYKMTLYAQYNYPLVAYIALRPYVLINEIFGNSFTQKYLHHTEGGQTYNLYYYYLWNFIQKISNVFY